MELQTYLIILRQRRWLIILTAVLTASVAAAGALFVPTRYTASSTMRVETGDGKQVGWDDMQYSDRVMNTVTQIAQSQPVIDQLALRLGLSAKPKVSAKILANTELIRLTVTARDPVVARDAANLLAEVLIVENRENSQRTNRLSLIEPAMLPLRPSTPTPALVAVLGLLVGLAGGVLLAFVFHNLDSRLYTNAQIEEVSGLRAIGHIPAASQRQLASIGSAHTAQHEAFRHLRTNLLMPGRADTQQLIMVTSATPKEGKSTIAAHLAYSMAQLGLRVLVIDADMRLPTIHRIFGLPNSTGLSNLLQQDVNLDDVLQTSEHPGLSVITGGPQPATPPELLGSPRMAVLIADLRQRFDVVLFDTPALLAVTDAAVFAPLVDSVLLVVGRAQTRPADLQQACRQLTHVSARVAGVVINRAGQDRSFAYYARATPRQSKALRPAGEEQSMH